MLKQVSAVAVALLPLSVFAAATPIPTTDAVAQIAEVNTAVLAVGGALIAAAAIAMAVKWVKASFF